jgi:hypothetical protein
MGRNSVFNKRTTHTTPVNQPVIKTSNTVISGPRISNTTQPNVIRPASVIQESTTVSSGSSTLGNLGLNIGGSGYSSNEMVKHNEGTGSEEKTVDPHTFNFDSIGKGNNVFSDSGRIEEYNQDNRDDRKERDDLYAAAELLRIEQEKIYGGGIRDSSQWDGRTFESLTTQTPSSGVAPDKVEPYKLKENVPAKGDFNQFGVSYQDPSQQAFNQFKSNYLTGNPDATGVPVGQKGDIMSWDTLASTAYSGVTNKQNQNTMSFGGVPGGSMNADSHGAVQTQYNKQNLSNQLNSDLKFWKNNFVNQYGKEDAPTREEAQAWVDKKKDAVKNRENTGGYNAGGFEHEYLSELDSRMDNLYSLGGSPTTTSNNGKNNKTGKITNVATTWDKLMDPNFSV